LGNRFLLSLDLAMAPGEDGDGQGVPEDLFVESVDDVRKNWGKDLGQFTQINSIDSPEADIPLDGLVEPEIHTGIIRESGVRFPPDR